MSRRIKVLSTISILFMVNFFLFILYNYTQTTKEFEFQREGEIKKNNKGQILSTEDNSDTNEKLLKENLKEKNEKNKENEAKNKELTYWVNQKNLIGSINQKTKERERNKNKIKIIDDEETDTINNKNNKSKTEEKPRFMNAVDDSEEFRSLIPFYKTYKKNILSEEDYDIYGGNWKNVRFGENVIPSLEGIKNRTEYKIKKEALMNDAIQVIKQEPDKQGKGTSYDDERELKFLLKYARDVETGVRKDELEPEWQWAADISIVYTWVNGSDPIHLEQKSKYNGGIKKVDSRDRCVDELRYSLRSVLKNLPWHKGKIFIVTPGQTPDWLDPSYDRIQIINQEDILPKKDINGNDVNPTFNSFTIEWYLDQIPGITEQFIQLNDDYFINHPLHPSYFFYGSGESYDIENDYIEYFNLENKLREDYPYFYFKFYKVSEHYQMTSKLSYNKYLENPSRIQGYLYCLREIIKNLNERISYDEINAMSMSCSSSFNSNTMKNKVNKSKEIIEKLRNKMMNDKKEREKEREKSNHNDQNNNNNSNNNNKDNSSIFDIEKENDSDNNNYEKLIKQENKLRDNEDNNGDRNENENENINVNENIKEEEEDVDIDEEEKNTGKKLHSKRYEYKPRDKVFLFPNAAQHFRYPNLYLALHYLINDMQYARNVGRKPFSYTTMGERFTASLAMTNGGIKSVFGRYIRTNQLEHAPYVWYRDLFPMSRAKFQNFIDATLTHKFRHPEDVIPPFANQAYLRYYASKRGFEEEFDLFHSSKYIYDTEEEAKERHSNRKIVKDRSVLKYGFHIVEDRLREKTMRFGQVFDDTKRNLKLYKDILTEPSLLFFNLNDDYTEPRVSEELHEFMDYLFPEKGEFEK